MSAYVKKVTFKLHESYANPNRVVIKPPYEITETGWGEFEITIKIFFVDPNERPITLYHVLKLFDIDPVTKAIIVKKNISCEYYDEIIFNEPSALLHQLLTNCQQISVASYRHETDFEEKEEKTLKSVMTAKSKVKDEIEELKDKLKVCQETACVYRKELESKKKTVTKEIKILNEVAS